MTLFWPARRFASLALPVLALALVGFSLPDALILHSSHGPINGRQSRGRGVFLPAEADEVVNAYAGDKRLISLPGAHHDSPLGDAQRQELHRAVAWLLASPAKR